MKLLATGFLVSVLTLAGLLLWKNTASPTEAKTFTAFSTPAVRYRINAGRSKFMVHAARSGLAWFKGKSHDIAIRNFSGEAELTPDVLNPASLRMTVRADSLEETRPIFTEQEKQIINKELDEIVLEAAKYPEITFRSTEIRGGLRNGRFEVQIIGDMTLHGVTRRVDIPALVTLEGNTLRATGEFELDRKDFNVKATNAFHGLVRVAHEVKFTFDIVAERA
jgi:polyisoprenoid-binding protein YceI